MGAQDDKNPWPRFTNVWTTSNMTKQERIKTRPHRLGLIGKPNFAHAWCARVPANPTYARALTLLFSLQHAPAGSVIGHEREVLTTLSLLLPRPTDVPGNTLHSVQLLVRFGKIMRYQPALARALRTRPALSSGLPPLIDACVACGAVMSSPKHVAMLAVVQLDTLCVSPRFWKALEGHSYAAYRVSNLCALLYAADGVARAGVPAATARTAHTLMAATDTHAAALLPGQAVGALRAAAALQVDFVAAAPRLMRRLPCLARDMQPRDAVAAFSLVVPKRGLLSEELWRALAAAVAAAVPRLDNPSLFHLLQAAAWLQRDSTLGGEWWEALRRGVRCAALRARPLPLAALLTELHLHRNGVQKVLGWKERQALAVAVERIAGRMRLGVSRAVLPTISSLRLPVGEATMALLEDTVYGTPVAYSP